MQRRDGNGDAFDGSIDHCDVCPVGKSYNLAHPSIKIISVRAFVHIQTSNKRGHTSWEGMVCDFSEIESNSYRIWNPKTRRVVESRNVVFIETPPNLLPAARRLSPEQALESLSYNFSDDTLNDNYVSHDGMLWDVFDYTSALDLGVDTPSGTAKLLLPQQASPGVFSPGGALPAGTSPGGFTTKYDLYTSTSAYTCFCLTKGN